MYVYNSGRPYSYYVACESFISALISGQVAEHICLAPLPSLMWGVVFHCLREFFPFVFVHRSTCQVGPFFSMSLFLAHVLFTGAHVQ